MCKRHLLLHCELARELWVSIFHLFCVEWAMLRRVVELANWRGHLGSRCILEAWRLTLLFLMWCILRERNAKNFKNCEKLVVELRVVMFKSLSTWIEMYIIASLVCSKFLDLCFPSLII